MAHLVAMMVRIKVHETVSPDYLKEILVQRLEGIGQGLDINCQYVLPDAKAQAEARGVD